MINESVKDLRVISFEWSLKYLFWVFVFMSSLSIFIAIHTGYYGGDLEGVDYKVDANQIVFFSFLYFITLFLIYFFSKFFGSKFGRLKSVFSLGLYSKVVFFLFLLILLLITVISVFVHDVGTIHRGVTSPRVLDLIFAFFQPYYLILFFLYFIFFNLRTFGWNVVLYSSLIIYTILVIFSGFTGFLFYILPFLIYFCYLFLGRNLTFFLLLISPVLFPFIRIFKFYLIYGFDTFNFSDLGFDQLIMFTKVVVDRFSYLPNMIYINNELKSAVEIFSSIFHPLFQGYFGSFFHKLFLYEPVQNINMFLTENIRNEFIESNSTFPLVSYLHVDFLHGFLVVFYAFLLVFVFIFFIQIGLSLNSYPLSFFVFLFFMTLTGGWFWNAINIIQSLIIFSSFIILISLIFKPLNSRPSKKDCYA